MKKIGKILVFFMVGVVVMQMLFPSGGNIASADHNETATLYCIRSMTINPSSTQVNASSLVAPFNKEITLSYNASCIKDPTKTAHEIAYCIDHSKVAYETDSISSNPVNTTTLLTNDQAALINYAILKGYNNQAVLPEGAYSPEDTNKYFATQLVIWMIKHDVFFKDTERTKIEEYFASKWPGTVNYYKELYRQVTEYATKPSFMTVDKSALKLNNTTKQYELSLPISDGEKYKYTVDEKLLPTDVKVDVTDKAINITSAKQVKSETKIVITRSVNEKGKLVMWKNMGGDKQPQVSLDEDEMAIGKDFEFTIGAGVVEDTNSNQNTTDNSDTNKQSTEPKYEVKEVDGSTYDTSPKTADESSITLAYKLIGVSLFTMITLFIVSLINRKRNRY